MAGELYSLNDVLKKTLFFFETLNVAELTPYVQQKMIQDYEPAKIENKIILCLRQHSCFFRDQKNSWRLNLEGRRENDAFYALLLKRQQPLNLKEVMRGGNAKGKNKNFKRIIAEEGSLISDGRFIQLQNGHWGLTEWEVEAALYSLKDMVIKSLKLYPAGLSAQQIFEVVSVWRQTRLKDVEDMLRKFPYFQKVADGIWSYNPTLRVVYEKMMKKFLNVLIRQKASWSRYRDQMQKRESVLKERLDEIALAHKEAAAALALRAEEIGRHEQMVTQMAEKDLLLNLRKKEIFRYRGHINKLEAKANSILYQCRLWVKKAREKEAEKYQHKEALVQAQGNIEALQARLQQYQERDRENKTRLAELKERHTTKVAELQTEIIELRQRLERSKEMISKKETVLQEEIDTLNNNLQEALRNEEDLGHSLRFLQQDLINSREEYRRLQRELRSPLIKLVLKLYAAKNWFIKYILM